MVTTGTRKSAGERRDEILAEARHHFAQHGLHGASTDAIARSVGISQPYLFRLFRTKKELFLASVERCFAQTHDTFAAAAEGKTGAAALEAMGHAYVDLITRDPDLLQGQLQAYAACDDPDVCAVVRAGYERLVVLVESTGVPAADVSGFFSHGMLINVLAAMGAAGGADSWGTRLLEGCKD
jgi:AcrR family transcriptional regulator